MKKPRLNSLQAGFSLLELSVVLVIIATLAGAGMTMLTYSVEQQALDITRERMAVIQKTLLQYRRAFHAIPCPADITLESSALEFGRGEVGAPTGDDCNDGTYSAIDVGSNIWRGAVPVRTLKLPDEFAYDGWGRRFTYVVDENYTTHQAFTLTGLDGTASPQVQDITNNAITNDAVYVLISHGTNGHGAYSRNGNAQVNAQVVNTNELMNCTCDSTGAPDGSNDVFIQGPLNRTNTTQATSIFDDIVVFATRAQLRADWE